MRWWRSMAMAVFVAGATTPVARAQENRPLALNPKVAPDEITYSVVYTGRLFGYFRYPEEQDVSMTACEAIRQTLGAAEHALVTEVDALKSGQLQVRAAVGDTFAPFLMSRVMNVNGGYVGKDLMIYDDVKHMWIRTVDQKMPFEGRVLSGTAALPFDNVACFLRLAHFDAIVPGKHDFHFGAERLRALSALLASPLTADDRFQFAPVQMLAANLSAVTRDLERVAVPDANIKRTGYTTKPITLPGNSVSAKPVLPAAALPWLRRFRVRDAIQVTVRGSDGYEEAAYDLDEVLARARFTDVELKKIAGLRDTDTVVVTDNNRLSYSVTRTVRAARVCAADDHDPTKIEFSTCTTLRPAVPTDGRLSLTWPYHMVAHETDPPDADVTQEFALAPGNHAICFYDSADAAGTPFCSLFNVQQPLFETAAPDARPLGACRSPENGRRVPYVLKGDGSGCVAVFGIVDPGLREYVGELNDTWLSKTVDNGVAVDHRSIRTDLNVSDPVEALTQLLQYCDADRVCSGARHVLLAQMPRAKAGQVAARFKPGTFDLVIAQTDTDRATGNITVSKRIALKEGDVDAIAEPTMVVPGQNFSNDDTHALHLRMHRATITVTPEPNNVDVVQIRNQVREPGYRPVDVAISHLPAVLPGGADRKMLFEWIAGSVLQPAKPITPRSPHSEKVDALSAVALKAMRDACNADVAILQRRDVFLSPQYERPPLSAPALRLVLDAIFWKGDFITCRTVTGDTLIKVMQRSAEIDAAESNSVFADQEFGRSVVSAGILRDGSDYIVSGLVVNAKKLYALATTDFLAEGDTGYAVLQTAEPKPDAIAAIDRIDRLSGRIFATITGQSQDSIDTNLPAGQYLDATNAMPADTTSLAWTTAAANWLKSTIIPKDTSKGGSALDRQTNQRSLWSVTLEKLTLSLKRYEHRHGEDELKQFFSGTGNTVLTTPETNADEEHMSLRVKRSSSWVDFYNLTELNQDRARTRNAKGAGDTVSSKTNTVANEIGALFNVIPRWRRNPSSYKVLAALRFETELRLPTQDITVQNQSDPNLVQQDVVQGTTDRTSTRSFKLGVRREFADGAFESGVVLARRDRPTRYTYVGTFANSPRTSFSCTLQASTALADCVKGNTTADPFVRFDRIDSEQFEKRPQFGGFGSLRLHVPLGVGRLKFFTDNSADWYRDRPQDDLTIDTDYSVRSRQQIEVPVVGNLSLAPTIEWYWYRNKGDEPQRHSFRGTSYTIEAKYSFDWRSGLQWKNVLRYPNPSEDK